MNMSWWRLAGFAGWCVLLPAVAAMAEMNKPDALAIPFVLEGRRVIIPTSVNGSKPLKLILDSGMGFDGVYLFHKEAVDLIDTSGAIEVRVPGAGDGESSRATMIETGRLAFGDVGIDNQRIVISHSEQTQDFSNDGVIGWSLFGHYAVEIDYDRELILLHDTAHVPTDSGWQILPIEVKNNIPFLRATVEVKPGESASMRVYIDLASREALELLLHENQKFTTPEGLKDTLLGTGLSGDIYGRYGRTMRVGIGRYELRDVRTAFAPAKTRSKQEGADGILGNDVIRRFNVIFDYAHQRLLLRPSKAFEEVFE